jgi:hypothetical protein
MLVRKGAMRECKSCKVMKERNYFVLNKQGKAVYRDETGGVWNGRTCYDCFKSYVKMKSGHPPLGKASCLSCGVEFQKKSHTHKVCSSQCPSKPKEE